MHLYLRFPCYRSKSWRRLLSFLCRRRISGRCLWMPLPKSDVEAFAVCLLRAIKGQERDSSSAAAQQRFERFWGNVKRQASLLGRRELLGGVDAGNGKGGKNAGIPLHYGGIVLIGSHVKDNAAAGGIEGFRCPRRVSGVQSGRLSAGGRPCRGKGTG